MRFSLSSQQQNRGFFGWSVGANRRNYTRFGNTTQESFKKKHHPRICRMILRIMPSLMRISQIAHCSHRFGLGCAWRLSIFLISLSDKGVWKADGEVDGGLRLHHHKGLLVSAIQAKLIDRLFHKPNVLNSQREYISQLSTVMDNLPLSVTLWKLIKFS